MVTIVSCLQRSEPRLTHKFKHHEKIPWQYVLRRNGHTSATLCKAHLQLHILVLNRYVSHHRNNCTYEGYEDVANELEFQFHDVTDVPRCF